jgi:dTDP-4-dehydrorhamnose 3,5-epimerase
MEVTPPAPRDRATGGPSIEGVRLLPLRAHVDHRGSLIPVMGDPDFWDEPVVHAYRITIRPGRIKGWGMHMLQADRYFIAAGDLRVVLYDGRVDAPSHGSYDVFTFGAETPALLRIPPGVWHADQNTGEGDAEIVNFPTRAYDPAAPDKYRIDPHSGEIPFDWSLRDG